MSQVKVFVTDRRTDGRTEGQRDGQTDEWDLMSPRFRESGGQKYMSPPGIEPPTLGFLVGYLDR